MTPRYSRRQPATELWMQRCQTYQLNFFLKNETKTFTKIGQTGQELNWVTDQSRDVRFRRMRISPWQVRETAIAAAGKWRPHLTVKPFCVFKLTWFSLESRTTRSRGVQLQQPFYSLIAASPTGGTWVEFKSLPLGSQLRDVSLNELWDERHVTTAVRDRPVTWRLVPPFVSFLVFLLCFSMQVWICCLLASKGCVNCFHRLISISFTYRSSQKAKNTLEPFELNWSFILFT